VNAAPPYEQILVSVSDHVATIVLNRPQGKNGYTHQMSRELYDALDRADADDDTRVVIVTGAGQHFCVGADLSDGRFRSNAEERGVSEDTKPARDTRRASGGWREPAGVVSMRMFRMNKPVIAAINGNAVGAGLTITLAADFRLGVMDGKFGLVFARRGITPEGVSNWFLPRLVGLARSLDWVITGRTFGAEEALEAGLLRSVHERDELAGAARALAHEIIANTAPVAVAIARQMLYRTSPLDGPDKAHRLESLLIKHLTRQPDAMEGAMSFLQRRPPEFPGRVSTGLPDFLPWAAGPARQP
jgi:enoyl-CoA hydratase/carnithine racemase